MIGSLAVLPSAAAPLGCTFELGSLLSAATASGENWVVFPDAAPAAAVDASDAVSGFFKDGRLYAGLCVLGLGAGQPGVAAKQDSAGAMFRPSSGDAVSSDCCSDRLRKSLRTK